MGNKDKLKRTCFHVSWVYILCGLCGWFLSVLFEGVLEERAPRVQEPSHVLVLSDREVPLVLDVLPPRGHRGTEEVWGGGVRGEEVPGTVGPAAVGQVLVVTLKTMVREMGVCQMEGITASTTRPRKVSLVYGAKSHATFDVRFL